MKFADVQVGMRLRPHRYPELGTVTVSDKGEAGFQFSLDQEVELPLPTGKRFARDGHYARAFAGEVEFEVAGTIQ